MGGGILSGKMTEEIIPKRRLLIATDNFAPRYDGITRFLREILPALKELYDVTVVCPDFGEVSVEGIRLERLPLSRWKVGDYQIPKLCFRRVSALVKEHDVVFSQGLGPIGYAAVRSASKKKRLILFTHSIDWELAPKAFDSNIIRALFPGLVKLYVRRQYRKCDLLLVPSENTSEVLFWNKIDTQRKIVHLGVDTKTFVPAKDKKEVREKLGLPTDKIIIGYHGRLSPEKDPKTLLRAFLRLKGAVLLVVGSGTPALERAFKRKGVILVPAKENVVPYLQAMDVYALTSLTETTSLSVLEAMSCELPVVSTPVGYVSDYIVPEENGILVPKQEPYAIAKQLDRLVKSEMLRGKLGHSARKTVEKDFTWDKTRKRISEIFESL